ncbi:MAG: bifunctional methionine sulfoxide reductase B/A protein [Phycisphaeraceae bacterium]|nr:bifunctional methionine sulfoxide reductase B/A protein [Phycisphaeraceae bacterium]
MLGSLIMAAACAAIISMIAVAWPDQDAPAAPTKDSTTMTPNTSSPAAPSERLFSGSGHDITPLSKERVAELAAALSPEAYKVTQNHGTEPPGSCGIILDNKKDGTYCCIVCGLPLFSSGHKFNSGTGWPSFFTPVDAKHIGYVRDTSYGMDRLEVVCVRCNAHLGHVFNDGPRDKTGLRYCINGVALQFHEKGQPMPKESLPAMTPAVAYFAGGCFWGIEHVFEKCPGVIDAESGYMNGHTENPTYEQVCSKKTGHAEAVKVVFDPSRVTYRLLLEGFFLMHDPTQLNRQGPDVGDQYRSGVFTVDEAQLAEAKAFVAELAKSGRFKAPIVTVVEPAKTFYKAEPYHQDYVFRTGRACHVSNPWSTVFGTAAAH